MLSSSFRAFSFVSFAALAVSSVACAPTQPPVATPATAIEKTVWEPVAGVFDVPFEGVSDDGAPGNGAGALGAGALGAPAPVSQDDTATVAEDGRGIPLGTVRTVFEGAGPQGGAAPLREARIQGEHTVRSPLSSPGGAIPQETVHRVVRQALGQAQMCYERGLQRDPGMAGRVSVALTVGVTGKVLLARADRGSELTDPSVVSCIEGSFYLLSFPPPEGGAAQLMYPLAFHPRT